MGCIALEYGTVEEVENNLETDAELRQDVYTVYDEFSDTTLQKILFNSKDFTKKFPKMTLVIRDILNRRGVNPDTVDKVAAELYPDLVSLLPKWGFSEISEIEKSLDNEDLRNDVYGIYNKYSDSSLIYVLFDRVIQKLYPKLTFIIRDILHSRGWNPYPESIDKDNNFVGLD